MPKFTVRLLPRAQADVQAIFDYISARSEQGSLNWFQAFEDALLRLKSDALSYGEAIEAQLIDRKIQQCLFKTPKGRTYRLRVRGPGQLPLHEDEL